MVGTIHLDFADQQLAQSGAVGSRLTDTHSLWNTHPTDCVGASNWALLAYIRNLIYWGSHGTIRKADWLATTDPSAAWTDRRHSRVADGTLPTVRLWVAN